MNEYFDSGRYDPPMAAAKPGPDREALGQRVKALFWLQLACIMLTVLGMIPGLSMLCRWLLCLVLLGVAVTLIGLQPGSRRFRKAAVWSFVTLAVLAAKQALRWTAWDITVLSVVDLALSVVVGLFQLIAAFQEYKAHGEMVSELDAALAGKWRNLFALRFLIALGGGFISYIALGFVAALEITALETALVYGQQVIGQIPLVIYLCYLHRTARLLRNWH